MLIRFLFLPFPQNSFCCFLVHGKDDLLGVAVSFFLYFFHVVYSCIRHKQIFIHKHGQTHQHTHKHRNTRTHTLTGQHDTRFSIGGTAAETISNESKRARRLVATDRNCPNQKTKNVAANSCRCLSQQVRFEHVASACCWRRCCQVGQVAIHAAEWSELFVCLFI